jgi:uncharacterized protein YukE
LDADEGVLDERTANASFYHSDRTKRSHEPRQRCEGRAAARAAVEMAADAQAAQAVQLAVETVGKSLRAAAQVASSRPTPALMPRRARSMQPDHVEGLSAAAARERSGKEGLRMS